MSTSVSSNTIDEQVVVAWKCYVSELAEAKDDLLESINPFYPDTRTADEILEAVQSRSGEWRELYRKIEEQTPQHYFEKGEEAKKE